MRRRDFFRNSGLSIGALSALGATAARGDEPPAFRPDDWTSVREQFPLTHDRIHMATFLLASHPTPVARAIEQHRQAFDANPAEYWEENFIGMDAQVQAAVAEYTGGDPNQIALTDSTTMGLGLVYNSLKLEPHQEAICTTHCHYSTQMSLQHRTERTGASTRQVPLYDDPATTSVDEIVASTRAAIRPNTRIFAVTWVHSCTGVKLPLKAMADTIAQINATRDEADRVLFCVDGVHGFGIEDVRIDEFGCDCFIAGTHKWMFGPRGTGIVWAKPGFWDEGGPVIPSFSPNYLVWMGRLDRSQVAPGLLNSPGGFHSFEHRWALPEAFRFHMDIGKPRVQARIHALNTQAKLEMAQMGHVKVHTPTQASLSSGIICFEVDGYTPDEVVEVFAEHDIIASTSPYRISYARLSPSLINNEAEVESCMRVLRDMA